MLHSFGTLIFYFFDNKHINSCHLNSIECKLQVQCLITWLDVEITLSVAHYVGLKIFDLKKENREHQIRSSLVKKKQTNQ